MTFSIRLQSKPPSAMSYSSRFSKGVRKVGNVHGRFKAPIKGHFRDDPKSYSASKAIPNSERIYGVQSVIGALTSKKREIYNIWMKTELSKSQDRYV